jgi:hypothetical protein
MARDFFITDVEFRQTPRPGYYPVVPGNITGFNSACNTERCLVLVTGDTSGAKADSRLVTLVADNLDTPVSSLSNTIRNRINSAMNTRNISVNINDHTMVRDFIDAVGRQFDPDFDSRTFFVIGD